MQRKIIIQGKNNYAVNVGCYSQNLCLLCIYFSTSLLTWFFPFIRKSLWFFLGILQKKVSSAYRIFFTLLTLILTPSKSIGLSIHIWSYKEKRPGGKIYSCLFPLLIFIHSDFISPTFTVVLPYFYKLSTRFLQSFHNRSLLCQTFFS